MPFRQGDHICALYSTTTELAREAARFLAEGLGHGERCWYVATGGETDAVRAALLTRGVDVEGELQRGALRLVSGDAAYVVHGAFDPEATIAIFNNAIEQAYTDGFAGFRAAADMSWALDCEAGVQQVILYEALLKPLFASCRAIGLCLYDRSRMPLDVINGALATHPLAATRGHYGPNPFYDPDAVRLAAIDEGDVQGKLAQLDRRNEAHY